MLASRIMQARRELRDLFADPSVARLVEPFDLEQFNLNMTVSENLLFGTVYGDAIDLEQLIDNPSILGSAQRNRVVQTTCCDAGMQISEIMLDLFSDVEPDGELFEQFSFINADDLPEFNQLLQRIAKLGVDNLPQTRPEAPDIAELQTDRRASSSRPDRRQHSAAVSRGAPADSRHCRRSRISASSFSTPRNTIPGYRFRTISCSASWPMDRPTHNRKSTR